MADLATVADLEARLGRSLDATETARVEALLAGASARVRSYTGQQFELTTTTDRVRARSGRLRLPQRPVVAVSALADMNGNDIMFTWHAGNDILMGTSGYPVRHPIEDAWYRHHDWVDVTYTHGYTDIPADVVEVVCQIALRAFGTPSETAGIVQESIGSYSYSVGPVAAAGATGLLNEERAALDPYRRIGGTIRVS